MSRFPGELVDPACPVDSIAPYAGPPLVIGGNGYRYWRPVHATHFAIGAFANRDLRGVAIRLATRKQRR
jgi:hypothetical protein